MKKLIATAVFLIMTLSAGNIYADPKPEKKKSWVWADDKTQQAQRYEIIESVNKTFLLNAHTGQSWLFEKGIFEKGIWSEIKISGLPETPIVLDFEAASKAALEVKG